MSSFGYYPIMVDLSGKRCLVVGGGEVASRKVKGLLEAGADDVAVVSPLLNEELAELQQSGRIRVELRGYVPEDVLAANLVFAATNQPQLNADIAEDARRLGIWANLADDGAKGSFITPAIHRQGDLVIALTTSGASPALASQIKQELVSAYGDEYAPRLTALRLLRERLLDASVGANNAYGLSPVDRRKLLRLAAADAAGWKQTAEALRQEPSQAAIQLERWMDSLRMQLL
ncbi:precorrin-2 dehydrogenase/sirohydrochlorin ferrochelatase family protein [Paenibacillus sp. MMS18-CY102]|uniref:precorrin-2 dehydrogenase/sirohydrochlorin ferrochelatase family protein n=1 Tax=Paenibacillus sp. MMS18-CY102 TaxID=2682849 RepID=UPI001365DD48|nr:bifunctional precorrin-2 dehydrogenase/sirohydrochlorin ferrochelatase [Paenibacillus sp. MMS18-CY102]MWC28730.1 bifunctional precorrin-2 dehydrogenase/sirohydrochlorin ferrochelatase [Paenibacillus sp. MMS18-CY102]